MNRKNNILFINPNWENKALVECFIMQGYCVIGYGGVIPGLKELSHYYRHISGAIEDYTLIIEIAKLYKVVAIASDNCDYSLLASELLAKLLSLPTLGERSAKISNNKLKQRELCSEHEIFQPAYWDFKAPSEAFEFLKDSAKPYMVKPCDSRGSIGITHVDKESEESDIQKALGRCLTASPSNSFIIEEYIEGELYTIDGFIQAEELTLVGIAQRERTGKGKAITTQILYKKDFLSDTSLKAYIFLGRVRKALGYTNGHIHCEAILNSQNEFTLVECTNRGAGVFTSSTINPYISRLKLNNAYVEYKTNGKASTALMPEFKIEEWEQLDASLIFPSLGESGCILNKFDLDKIHSNDQVLAVQLFSKIGRPLPVSIDGPSRHCAITLKTSNINEIKDIISKIKHDHVLTS